MAPSTLLLHSLVLFHIISHVFTQTISTSTPVPPLQWINLTNLLKGTSNPPPLKDASIGYDETSRSLIIFGGESENGFPQSQTYLLNLESLTWSTPTPPTNLGRSPPARSAAVSGCDFAASNRHGFVVIGGKGSDGTALSDVWEYDFNNQFWSEVGVSPGGPSPRWGAAGGIDIRVSFISDPVVPGPNNTFYLAGGYDGTTASPLSDVWRFNISGTLSSNLPNDSAGSWEHITTGSLPARIDLASTMISQQIVAAGGCSLASAASDSCPQQDSYVIDARDGSEISPGPCPSPRQSPVLVANVNTFSSSFSSQVFLLLGTFDTNAWNDTDGLTKGEVAVLDTNTGSWSRIIPAGDPGMSGQTPTFPSPREGSAAFSYSLALVGESRTTSSDTLIFGGRDASGNYLSDIWLLRAYQGSVTSSGATWSGYGNGKLQTGVDATGTGVRNQYLSTCATAIKVTSSGSIPSSTSHSSSASGTLSPTSSPHSTLPTNALSYETSILHKLLLPLSLTLLLPATILYRLASSSDSINGLSSYPSMTGIYLSGLLTLAAYGMGVAGLAMSFTTITTSTSSSSLHRRSSVSGATLKTKHGQLGLAFFVGLYGLVPLIAILSICFKRSNRSLEEVRSEKIDDAKSSMDTTEMLKSSVPPARSATQSMNSASRPSSPRPRTQSWGPSSLGRIEGGLSSDSESAISTVPQRRFEVLNRPAHRKRNDSRLSVPMSESSHPIGSRSLGHIDWLQRRRSLNAVGELDYAITQVFRAQHTPPTPATTDALVPTLVNDRPTADMPHLFDIILHSLFHFFLLGICIITLIALWSRAPLATFVVFLAWTLAFYVVLLVLAWDGRPSHSSLAVIITRLRGKSSAPISCAVTSPQPQPVADAPVPFPSQGPYVHHRPPYRATTSDGLDNMSLSHEGAEIYDDDDDDEDTRQRRIEHEMERRDVSIVTVPKRKLWITNPS